MVGVGVVDTGVSVVGRTAGPVQIGQPVSGVQTRSSSGTDTVGRYGGTAEEEGEETGDHGSTPLLIDRYYAGTARLYRQSRRNGYRPVNGGGE